MLRTAAVKEGCRMLTVKELEDHLAQRPFA